MEFEDMTIKQLRKLTEEFKRLTPEFQTAEDILKEKNEK